MAKNLTNISLAGGGGATNQSVANSGSNAVGAFYGNDPLDAIKYSKFGVLSSVGTIPTSGNSTSASLPGGAPYSNEAFNNIVSQGSTYTPPSYFEQMQSSINPNQFGTGYSSSNGTSDTPSTPPANESASQTDYQALLNALYAQQQANAQTLNAQQQQNALDAYNRNMAAMNDAYNTRLGLLGGNFDTTMGLLDSNYAQAQAQQRQSAEDALRQAYIDRMMGEKNLTQQLVANGISGGASESARAGLINSYGNSRNAIQRGLMDNLAGLEGNYLTNAHNARQAYNDALANAAAEQASYKAQFSSDLANGNATSYSDYFNQMANLDNTYLSRMGDILANNQSYAQKLALADAEAQAAQQKSITNDWRVGYVQDAIKNNLSKKGIAEYLVKHLMNAGYSEDDSWAETAEIMNKAGVTLD